MYKIYINERPLTLCSVDERPLLPTAGGRHLVMPYTGRKKSLFNFVDTLEKASPKVDAISVYAPDLDQLWQDFMDHYRLIEAAGGLVRNPQGEWLLIYRLEHWDLPKGKIDPGESREAAALREVQEETGLHQLTLRDFLLTTYHTYRDREGKRVLKPTYWYQMDAADTELVPQTEENIELATWFAPAAFWAEPRRIYPSIRLVLDAGKP